MSRGELGLPKYIEIEEWLRETLARELDLEPSELDVREPFTSYGLSSVQAVTLSGDLERFLGRSLSPTLAYDHPTIEALASHLSQLDAPGDLGAMAEESRAAEEPPTSSEMIAITGMGCRFPGAGDLRSFWTLLYEGNEAITEVPRLRWDSDRLYDPDPMKPGKMNTRWGGFIDGVDRFDAAFFGISRREAERMDPQHRLLLEVAWEALEDAGEAPDLRGGSSTGVYVGISTNDYGRFQFLDPALCDPYVGTGNALSIAANRLSYTFNFKGPSLAVDTACSSSLVALHLACRGLRQGDCEVALAGGVSLMFSPAVTVNFSKAGFLSPDGRCRAFDAAAQGYVRGEGGGVVVLKRLSSALRDGDAIYAVIRGSAVNQDGRTNGLTAPNGESQQAVLRAAYRDARVSPGRVQYVEAHGTGTPLGDPIEANTLGAVLAEGRDARSVCSVGSVKTNIGHLEAAAGMAGLIKLALMLHRRTLVPSLHFSAPNPHIPFDRLPLRVQTTREPWPASDATHPDPAGSRCLAGLSAFGFGGTNAHVVLEAAPVESTPIAPGLAGPASVLLPLSARSPKALRAVASSYRALLTTRHETPDASPPLRDLVVSAGTRRVHHDLRLAVSGRSDKELADRLGEYLEHGPPAAMPEGTALPQSRPRLAFVFSGQGSLWTGLGRDLLREEPVFGDTLAEVDDAFAPLAGWSIRDALFSASASDSRLLETAFAPPILLAYQLGLAALWSSWAIEPSMVVGNGIGEIAAARVAGALSLKDAACIAYYCGRLMQQTHSAGTTAASAEQLTPELVRALRNVQPRTPTIPIYSTVTGQLAQDGEFRASYWARTLGETGHFAEAIRAMNRAGTGTFLELSPDPALTESTARAIGDGGVALPSVRRGQPERLSLLRSLGALYTLGHPVDWDTVHHGRARFVRLPPYPWQRDRYWLDVPGLDGSGFAALPIEAPAQMSALGTISPLLGSLVRSPVTANTVFETRVHAGSLPYLEDHRIQGEAVLPASAFLEMALSAGRALFGEGVHQLEDVRFERPLVLTEKPRTVQIVFDRSGTRGPNGPRGPSGASWGLVAFEIFSHAGGDDAWTRHASGNLRSGTGSIEGASLASIRSRCREALAAGDFYSELARQGLEYGPRFRGVIEIARGESDVLAELRMPGGPDAYGYQAHPVLLDCAFQAIAAASRLKSVRGPFVPTGIDRLALYNPLPGTLVYTHVSVLPSENDGVVEANIRIFGEDERTLLAEVHGLRLQRLTSGPALESPRDALLEVRWERQSLPNVPPPTAEPGSWLILADRDGFGEALAEVIGQRGETCRLVFADPRPGSDHVDPEDLGGLRTWMRRAFGTAGPPCRGVIYLWPLDAPLPDEHTGSRKDPDTSAFAPAHRLGVVGLMHLTQALLGMGWRDAPRLWIVTRNACAVVDEDRCESIGQSPVWGLGRVVALEHPELRCTRIDLSAATVAQSATDLCTEIVTNSPDEHVAYREGHRLVARLVQALPEDTHLPQLSWMGPQQPPEEISPPEAVGSFALSASPDGVLDGLSLRGTGRVSPGPEQVEIAVRAAGLNFRDVMKALGIYPSDETAELWLGDECAGQVVAVGEGVVDIAVGDEVIALAQRSMGSFVTTPASLVAQKPERIGFEVAATLPVAFLTAEHSLHGLAHLERGERVLIHSAAGGVGLAAVQLAQRAGAEIFATAGSAEKRAFLTSMGVPHVLDSRTLDFAQEILRLTNGRGVDIVLNSLAGEGLRQSMQLLAPSGRFVEIGKRDVYENRRLGLGHLKRNISLFVVDMDALFQDRPALAGTMLRTLADRIQGGTLEPLPVQAFSIGEAARAFRMMAKAEQIGKIALDLSAAPTRTLQPVADLAHSEGTILITGGFGALGLAAARSIVERGGRHVALLGRSDPGESVRHAIDGLRADAASRAGERSTAGTTAVQIEEFFADVAHIAALRSALEQVERTMPPIRGVIHAAGVLDDAVVYQMTQEKLLRVLAPKVEGAWNLHQLTQNKSLDAFVMFSSAASLLGAPGQGNYAAANAFLDALAQFRVARGLPALSINWGPWAEIGMAASQTPTIRGVDALHPQEALRILHRLATRRSGQIGVVPLNVRHWQQFYPQAAGSPFLSRLVEQEHANISSTGSCWRDELLASESPAERRRQLEDRLRRLFAQVLRVPVSAVDRGASLDGLGADSLLALELKNHLEAASGIRLPATLLFGGQSTVAELATDLARRMDVPLESATTEFLERAPRAMQETQPAPPLDVEAPETARPSKTAAPPEAPNTTQPGDSDDSDLPGLLEQLEALSDEEASQLLSDIRSDARDDGP